MGLDERLVDWKKRQQPVQPQKAEEEEEDGRERPATPDRLPRVISHVEEEWGLFEVSRPAAPGEVAEGSGEAPRGGATGGD